MEDNQIFVLSSVPRSGSTWVQRIITAHGAMIWGEWSLLTPFKQMYQFGWNNYNRSPHRMAHFAKDGANMWMALLHPDKRYCHSALPKFLNATFGEAAKDLGYSRWGCKETRWSPSFVEFLKTMFPTCKIVYLVRHFDGALRSHFNSGTGYRNMWDHINSHTDLWIRNGRFILDRRGQENEYIVKYEDLASDRENIRKLVAWLGLKQLKNVDFEEKCGDKIGSCNQNLILEEANSLSEPRADEINDLLNAFGYEPKGRNNGTQEEASESTESKEAEEIGAEEGRQAQSASKAAC